MNPSALVTGATGFVGSHLVRTLCVRGWRVTALVRPRSDASRLSLLQEAGAELATLSAEPAALPAIVARARPDVVFHLATLFRGEHTMEDVEPLVVANVLFGTQLLEAMRWAGASRIISAGSAWEHHDNRDYSPVSLYAATKGAFNAILAYYAEVQGIRAVTLDLTDTYGPGDPRAKLLRLLRAAAASGEPLAMNAGEPYIDLLHVNDAVDAFLVAADRAMTTAGPLQERWAVRPQQPLRLRELVAVVGKILGAEVPVRWGGRPYRAREAFTPWTSGTLLPGWAPRVTLEEGLRTLDG